MVGLSVGICALIGISLWTRESGIQDSGFAIRIQLRVQKLGRLTEKGKNYAWWLYPTVIWAWIGVIKGPNIEKTSFLSKFYIFKNVCLTNYRNASVCDFIARQWLQFSFLWWYAFFPTYLWTFYCIELWIKFWYLMMQLH